MRVKCSAAISALEYEVEHLPNAQFSAQILHNNCLFLQNFLVLKVLKISISVSNKIMPGVIRFGQNYLLALYSPK